MKPRTNVEIRFALYYLNNGHNVAQDKKQLERAEQYAKKHNLVFDKDGYWRRNDSSVS